MMRVARSSVGTAIVLATFAIVSPTGALDASAVNGIIKDLAPIAGQTGGPGPATRREPVEVAGRTVLVDPDRRFEQDVFFALGSASLTLEAKSQLAALGLALASPRLVPFSFVVAGHTDAAGDDAANVDLSDRRAAAVATFLANAYPIDPHRLVAVGFGARKLKRPDFPLAAVNRRVEILMIVE